MKELSKAVAFETALHLLNRLFVDVRLATEFASEHRSPTVNISVFRMLNELKLANCFKKLLMLICSSNCLLLRTKKEIIEGGFDYGNCGTTTAC